MRRGAIRSTIYLVADTNDQICRGYGLHPGLGTGTVLPFTTLGSTEPILDGNKSCRCVIIALGYGDLRLSRQAFYIKCHSISVTIDFETEALAMPLRLQAIGAFCWAFSGAWLYLRALKPTRSCSAECMNDPIRLQPPMEVRNFTQP